MTADEFRQAAAELVERSTRAQALPGRVTDRRLLERAAAMVTPPKVPTVNRRRRAA